MSRTVERIVVNGLAPAFRVVERVKLLLRLEGIARVVRHAWWQAKLGFLGSDTKIHSNVVIHGAKRVSIGERCSLTEFVHIWGGGGVTIGDDVLIASHVAITSLTHDKDGCIYRDTIKCAPVVIEDNVWIGTGAVILPGVTLGKSCIVGAGAVVTRDVDAGAIVAGIPARRMAHSGALS